jgi:hypothetical protein
VTFAKRKIDVTFLLGQGSFGESGADTVKVSGLRCSASITMGTGVAAGELNLRINGLALDIMNRLTVLKQDFNNNMGKAANYVKVEAGDDDAGMSTVFYGGISEARADLSGMPDTSFELVAYIGILDTLKPVPPLSYKGQIDAALVMQDIAASMGRTLENSGVAVQLRDPYFAGTATDQMNAVARAGNFTAMLDPTKQVLAIWPLDGKRQGLIPLINKDTGLVGYPTYAQNGISLTSLYLPGLSPGGLIKIETDLTPAAGQWSTYLVSHDLEAQVPGGRWFTHIEAGYFGSDAPIVER